MAITKATARAPCPLFTGRGFDKGGFTMLLPYKTYLTCHPDNIAAERSMLTLFNYDLAEYVYNKAADAYGFGIFIETGAYTDAITDGKHMYGLKVHLMCTEDYSLGAGERHNCDIRSAAFNVEARDDVSGVIHGIYVSARVREKSTATVLGGYYLANTQTYAMIGIEARTESVDGSGTDDGGITMGGSAYGVVGVFIAHKCEAAITGEYAALCIHTPWETGTDVFSTTTTGIRFDVDGIWAGTDFDVGIDFASAVTKGINIDACSVAMDADVTLTTADNAMEIIVTSTGALSAGYIQAAQFTVNHSTGALTGTNELHVIAIDTALTGGSSRGVPYWYGLTIYMSTSANPVTSYMSAISVYIDNQGDACVDIAILDLGQALASALTGGTRSCYIRMRRHGTVTLKTALRLEGIACTNLLSFDNGNQAPISTQAGGTLTITQKIAIDVNGTTRYIPVGTIA